MYFCIITVAVLADIELHKDYEETKVIHIDK